MGYYTDWEKLDNHIKRICTPEGWITKVENHILFVPDKELAWNADKRPSIILYSDRKKQRFNDLNPIIDVSYEKEWEDVFSRINHKLKIDYCLIDENILDSMSEVYLEFLDKQEISYKVLSSWTEKEIKKELIYIVKKIIRANDTWTPFGDFE